MKTKICFLIVGLCLVSVSAAFAATRVVSAAFVGTVDVSVMGEVSSGRWLIAEGGSFEGTVTVRTLPDGSVQTIKEGILRTSTFEGEYKLNELRRPDGTVEGDESWAGIERLSDGTFDGTKTIRRHPDGAVQTTKNGVIRSSDYEGEYKLAELRRPDGAVEGDESWNGIERLSDGTFDGTKTIRRHPDGAVQTNTNGVIRSANYEGEYKLAELRRPDGAVEGDESWAGIERLSDGTFDGTNTIRRYLDGAVQTTKNGVIRSSVFEGEYSLAALKRADGVTEGEEQWKGIWNLSSDEIVEGAITIIQNPDGTVTRIDSRRPKGAPQPQGPLPAPNQAPEISQLSDMSVDEGDTISFNIEATDADRDTLQFDNMIPQGASCSVVTSEPGRLVASFKWTPDFDQANLYRVGFKVSDGKEGCGTSITIEVKDKVGLVPQDPTPSPEPSISPSPSPSPSPSEGSSTPPAPAPVTRRRLIMRHQGM